MEQDNLQLNIDESSGQQTRKIVKFWDILLWVVIIVLAAAVFVRLFVISKVTVWGDSMTASYYGNQESTHYNPALTYHHKDTVTVNKMKKPKRGDVVVFYKYPVKSKFKALFASGNSTEKDGEYYKLIKRVVAIGGDKLWLDNVGLEKGQYRLIIQTSDGDILREDKYTKNNVTLDADCFILYAGDVNSGLGRLAEHTEQNPLVIEEGNFFAMGDNRVNSEDSRGSLGQVSLSQLFGVVV